MKNEILSSLDNPAALERLYRGDKPAFRRAFQLLKSDLSDSQLVQFWSERLHSGTDQIAVPARQELLFLIFASLLAGLLTKLPAILRIDESFFYERNAGFIVFPLLTLYFALKNDLKGRIAIIAGVLIASLIFINSLPKSRTSDTLSLSCIHVVLVQWAVLGFSFIDRRENYVAKSLAFLKYNGDLLVMTQLIVVAGAIMSAITIGLFELIGFNITEFYFNNLVILALPAAPIMGTYLTQSNPQLVGKIAPLIAKIFSPIVLLMLTVYLSFVIFSGRDLYNDRMFLMLFNVVLIGVMALIFFSVAGSLQSGKSRTESWILFLLSLVTIIVNGFALSAILFRISEWGFTANRSAVLGANVLMLVHLFFVARQLFRLLSDKAQISQVGRSIVLYLPVYAVWAAIVAFVFPLIFGFK